MSISATLSGLDISARPLAQASVKSVGRVQITDLSFGRVKTYPGECQPCIMGLIFLENLY